MLSSLQACRKGAHRRRRKQHGTPDLVSQREILRQLVQEHLRVGGDAHLDEKAAWGSMHYNSQHQIEILKAISTDFANFSTMSQVQVSRCIAGRTFDHMMVPIGTFVLSCEGAVTPSALSFADAIIVVTYIFIFQGSANLSPLPCAVSGRTSSGVAFEKPPVPCPGGLGSPAGSSPVIRLVPILARAVTKLAASDSTASPGMFSGAPVTES